MIECSSLLVTSHTVFRWTLFHEEFVVLLAAHDVARAPSIFSGRAWILKAKMFLLQNAPGFRQKLKLARYPAQMSVPITLPGQIGRDVLEFAVKGKVTLWNYFLSWNYEVTFERNIREYRVLDVVGSNFNESCQAKIEKRDCPLDDCYVTMWQVSPWSDCEPLKMQRTKIGETCYRGTRSRKVQCVRLSGENFDTKTPVDK